MRLSKLALLAALCCGGTASMAWGQTYDDDSIGSGLSQVGYFAGGQADCGCSAGACDGGCASGYSNSGGCDSGCNDSCCNDLDCGGGLFNGRCLTDCDLGDPCSLLGDCCGHRMGGWFQWGYHDQNTRTFNNRKNDYQLHQAWLYAEKRVDTSNGGGGLGYRFDYIYGTDGPDTQAFGTDPDGWDNSWDNGPDNSGYGSAIPQLYLEAGYGDWTAKVGHFYTIIGYEVVAAPDNFFYSHAYTMYNSEPFTHSGALFTYHMNEDIDVFGGYVLGWDSGFEDNGDAYLGGSSVKLTEDINVTSTLVAGRFNETPLADERGFMSSTVVAVQLTEKLQYIFQTDYLDTENSLGETVRDTFDISQYLIRQLSDCVSLGTRFEFWQVQSDSQGLYGDNAPPWLAGVATGDLDIYALTLGMNVQPHANVLIRPEVRFDWVEADPTDLVLSDMQILENNDDQQTTFGIDTIILF